MKSALKFMIFFTFLTGVLYPLLVTGMGQLLFSAESNGSILKKGDTIIGSELVAQKFVQEIYFWPRPSANDWKTSPSGASNFAPTALKLKDSVDAEKNKYKQTRVGEEMFFMSASGLDPHISPLSIKGQIPRVVKARRLSPSQHKVLNQLIDQFTDHPNFGFLGRERVNILKLNLAMDQQL